MRPEIAALSAAVGASLVSMLVFGATSGKRDPSGHTKERGSFALGSWIREWFYWVMRPAERAIETLHVPPEVFNALGVAFAVGSGAAYAHGDLPWGGVLLLLSGLADVLDGVAARARGLVSRRGAFLDSTLDRFAEAAVFVGLAAFVQRPAHVMLVVAALSGSLLVSYTRARGEGLGLSCRVGVLQRAERMLLLGLASWVDPAVSEAAGRASGFLLLPVLAVIAVGSVGTAIYRTFWIARRLD